MVLESPNITLDDININNENNLETAKEILDRDGPGGLSTWVRSQERILITDTTMRDAHQSLLATRVRTQDLVKSAKVASKLLKNAFSFEMWGGATFDVCYRFLHEDPWERLREIRKACPNVCLQMLIRGSNAVGYTSYPDNAVIEFVNLASKNGIDIFRIFDCFNDIEQMKVCINAVRDNNKVAEVCVCYTADLMTSKIYNLEYYKECAKIASENGAHIIGIKDMAGLLKPKAAIPLINAIREVTDLPIHFHTHSTSSASLSTAIEMASGGCDIIDFAIASMADCTSQPSLNAFLAAFTGTSRDPLIDYLSLEPLDMYWSRVRAMYSPFENGMKSGTARVYDHQIPGGQYSNLMVQCKAMGLWDKWEEVLDMYRDVNYLLGDIIKVTPSSKCVGDLALYLITRGFTTEDIVDEEKSKNVDFPQSVIDLAEGRLGFPHQGFPKVIQRIILKDRHPLTERPSSVLDPINWDNIKSTLESEFNRKFTLEEAVSAVLYPKVYRDYLNKINNDSGLLTYLPTPVFWYSMQVNQEFQLNNIPNHLATEILSENDDYFTQEEKKNDNDNNTFNVTIKLNRIGPIKQNGKRTIYFLVNNIPQNIDIEADRGESEFDGPMADTSNENHVASPMPGLIEVITYNVGDEINEGDIIAKVSAMKMEVDIKCPFNAIIEELMVEEGGHVVEGALVCTLKKL